MAACVCLFVLFFNSIFSSSRGKKAEMVLPFLSVESPSCQRFSGVREGHWHTTYAVCSQPAMHYFLKPLDIKLISLSW